MNVRHLLLASVTSCLLLSGCMAPNPDINPPKPPIDLSWPELFDDFHYQSSRDAQLASNGWQVSARTGSPGTGTFGYDQIQFTQGNDGQRLMHLDLSSDGTVAGSGQAELISSEQKFFEGTYAARVYFSDAPITGPKFAHDTPVQTFYSITPLHFPLDPEYSELDFEYLPNGGWGTAGPNLFLSSWNTYQADPWIADNQSNRLQNSFSGWRTLVLQVMDGVARYYIDGQLVAEHGGKFYPVNPMYISFNHWWIHFNTDQTEQRIWRQSVDWVYVLDQQLLSPSQVEDRIRALRDHDISFRDQVPSR